MMIPSHARKSTKSVTSLSFFLHLVVSLLLVLVPTVHAAFDIPSLPKFLNPQPGKISGASLAQKKQNLLEAVSFTNNGKTADLETQERVLGMVIDLEKNSPPSPNLLSDPKQAMALDGVWYLQYTSPSVVGDKDEFPDAWKPSFASEGESNIETRPYQAKGSVSAAGISVDTSNRPTIQSFDVPTSRVENVVDLDWGRVRVAGPFRQSPNVPNRAIVGFEDLDITLKTGLELKLGLVFSTIGFFRGTMDSGWLETTYLDDELRIGRGNKGTMFVLTRDPDAVKP